MDEEWEPPKDYYYIGNLYIEFNELQEVVERDLRTHLIVMRIIRDHIDNILMNEFNINPVEFKNKDPSTYWAIIMELTRSELINLKDYIKYKIYSKKRREQ